MNGMERERIETLNRALLAAWGPGGSEEAAVIALRCYLSTRSAMAETYRMFEIANHRVFRTDRGLLVPYDIHGLLLVYELEPGTSRLLLEQRFPHGTIFNAWARAVKTTLENIERDRLAGIGFAMPGPFDYRNGISKMEHKFPRLVSLGCQFTCRESHQCNCFTCVCPKSLSQARSGV